MRAVTIYIDSSRRRWYGWEHEGAYFLEHGEATRLIREQVASGFYRCKIGPPSDVPSFPVPLLPLVTALVIEEDELERWMARDVED